MKVCNPKDNQLDQSRCPSLHKSLLSPELQTVRVVIPPENSGGRKTGDR